MLEEDFDEAECLSRLRDGDESAARDFLGHFRPFVLKLVRAHLPRRVSEEDLVQMTFIRAFQNLGAYTGKAPVEHWLSRIAVNTCLNSLRAEKYRPEWRLADFPEETAARIQEFEQVEPDVASQDDVRMAQRILRQMLDQLSPSDRLLITLLYLEEKSVTEIHALTGWSRAAIKVRAFRARSRMKKMLTKTEVLALAGL